MQRNVGRSYVFRESEHYCASKAARVLSDEVSCHAGEGIKAICSGCVWPAYREASTITRWVGWICLIFCLVRIGNNSTCVHANESSSLSILWFEMVFNRNAHIRVIYSWKILSHLYASRMSSQSTSWMQYIHLTQILDNFGSFKLQIIGTADKMQLLMLNKPQNQWFLTNGMPRISYIHPVLGFFE